MKARVAILGAGPSGLAQMHAFEQVRKMGADVPDLVCFEKQSDWGGLWNFDWRTGLDEYGEPVHGSMYRYLWSNGPKECLEFADYTFEEHFKRPIPSFPPREVLYNYILARAEKSGVRHHIRFNSAVRLVAYSDDVGKFTVTAENLKESYAWSEDFDYVIVATGHYSIPNAPYFDGIETFPGRVCHSHDFRESREFAGQDLLVIGSSYSAEDIALQCHKYGAKSVTISYRNSPMGFKWPEGMVELPLLTKVDGKTAHFKDGSSRDVDAIILCTGYLHKHSFLEDSLRLKSRNRLYPPDLYKGIFWNNNPRLMYLGMQDQYYTFPMFDAQAWYARDHVLGRIAMPSKTDMEKDMAEWKAREEALSNPTEDIDFQTDYIKDLCRDTDYTHFDLDLAAENFKRWEHHKGEDIQTYRDRSHASPCTGTVAPVHHTPWMKAMDDSMATFLKADG